MRLSTTPCQKMPSGDSGDAWLALRQIFGQFASGVTVIRSGVRDSIYGMTANAFMSVPLEPALILISLQNDSRMRKVTDVEGRFGVSSLAVGQQSVSDHFAGRIDDQAAAQFDYPSDTPLLFFGGQYRTLSEGALS